MSPSFTRSFVVRALLATVAAALLLCIAWVLLAAKLLESAAAAEPSRADVVIALAGQYRRKIPAAAGVFQASRASRLILSYGPASNARFYDPDDAVTYLTSRGVPRDAIRVLHGARSTASEAALVATLARRCLWKRMVVVTAPTHARRAHWLFSRSLASAPVLQVVKTTDKVSSWLWWKSEYDRLIVGREWLKLLRDLARYSFARPSPRQSDVAC